MAKEINNKRREQLKDLSKTLMALAAVSLAPSLSYAANLTFAPKGQTFKTMVMDGNGNVIINALPENNTNNRKLYVNGTIEGTQVFNAVWNDMAEFRPLKSGTQRIPGKAYVATEAGLVLSSKKAEIGTVGICSDTFGYALGKDSKDTAPIGISGWVLAYVDKKYPVGTALVSGANGILTKASVLDKILNPERIIGIVETSPAAYNNLKIDGRYWVKIG